MATWTCPDCGREFGAVGRSHMCQPGLTVEQFLADSPEFVRPVFERVKEILVEVDSEVGGDLIVDPLGTKVLFKNGPTFCILGVMKKWVGVAFTLRRRIESDRLSRKTTDLGGKYHHVVNVDDASIIDAEFAAWLAEAYHLGDESGTASAASADPMIPDDIDFEINPAS